MWKSTASYYKKQPDLDKQTGLLQRWVFDSHYWVETMPGYWMCEWCEFRGTSEFPVSIYKLCKNNPELLK